ncbi:MAG: M1 family metallopeptidase [Thermoanaerobaculum sp.]
MHKGLVALALLWGVGSWGQTELPGVAREVANLRLGAKAVPVEGRQLTAGGLTLVLKTGTLTPVLAGERDVGWFFVGNGEATYKVQESLLLPVFAYNVKNATSVGPFGNDALKTECETALILSADAASLFPSLPESGQAPPQEAFSRHRERFSRDLGFQPQDLLPAALLEDFREALSFVELHGPKDDFVFILDPLVTRGESFAVLRPIYSRDTDLPEFKGRRFQDTLVSVPLGRGFLDFAPDRFFLSHLDVTVVHPEGIRGEVTARETFTVLEPVRVLPLSLWSEQVITAGVGSKPKLVPYTLASVTTEDGRELPFVHREGKLLVDLGRKAQAGEKVTLTFRMGGDVLYNPGNDQFWMLPTSSWFATPYRVEMQHATYHAVVKTKKPFLAFSSGKLVKRWEEGELACAEFASEKPLMLPVILAGKYKVSEETRNGRTVRVASYVAAEPRGVKKVLNNAFTLMEFFEPYLGPYPFPELSIIEINQLGWGQAPPGVIFITREAFTPLQDDETRLFSEGVNARFTHEMAHAWWGHVAKLTMEDQWLSESVAEYYAAFAMGKLWRESEFKKALKDWEGRAKFVKDTLPVFFANQLAGPEAWRDRMALLYAKGPLMLHALRQELGDNGFFTVFKSYLRNFADKPAQTKHIVGITGVVAKRDFGPWFERYLLGPGFPLEKK